MADIVDKHRDVRRRVRKLELEISVREGSSYFANLAKHSNAITEHLCRPTEVTGAPYGRLAAHLFDAEQAETNLEILRLLRVQREKVGAMPWIGNYGEFAGPNIGLHTNFGQFDGHDGSDLDRSPLNFLRVGRWVHPVIMPKGAAISGSWLGAPTDEKWSVGQVTRGPQTFALSSIGGFPPRSTGFRWLPVPAGVPFDGVEISGGRIVKWQKGPDKEPPEYNEQGDRIQERVPYAIESPNNLFVLGAYISGAPRVCYTGGEWGASFTRTLDYETCAVSEAEHGSVPGFFNPFWIDAGPPAGEVGYVRDGADKPLPYQGRDTAFTREVMATLAERFSDPTSGLNLVEVRQGAGSFPIRGPRSRETTGLCKSGDDLVEVTYVAYNDGGIGAGMMYYCFPTDWIRSAGPPIEVTPAINNFTTNRFTASGDLASLPWEVPNFETVLNNVNGILATPGEVNITVEELEELGYYVPYPDQVLPGTQEVGFPQALIEWYSRLLGSDIYETELVNTYPGTAFPFDEETYQHDWTLLINDNRGTVWYIVRHDVVHLKGFVTPNTGYIKIPLGLRPPIAAGTSYTFNYCQIPLVAADGSQGFAFFSSTAAGLGPGEVAMDFQLGGPDVHPYYLDGVRWPIA